jgi:cell division septal protein FtsQ
MAREVPVKKRRLRRKAGVGRAVRRTAAPRPVSFARIRARRILIALAFCGVVAAVGQVSWSFFSEAPYFKLSRLQVEGVADPVAEELRGIVETAAASSRNMLNLDTGELQRLIAAHPRIRNFQFEKLYPDTLLIRATEREPAAIVSADGFYLVDREGFVMEQLRAATLRKHDLPYVTGIPNDQIQPGEKIYNSRVLWALDLIRVLHDRNPDLYAKCSEVNLSADPVTYTENISVQLKGGTQVRFGDKNPIEKLPSLEFFLKMQQEQNADPFALAYIDLRFKDQIVFMDRATAVAAAAGVLEKLQDGTLEPRKQANKPNKNDSQNKSDSVVSKAIKNDDQSGKPERKAAPPREAARRTTERPRESAQPVYAPQYQAPAVVQSAPPASASNATRQRGVSRFAFWRRDSQPAQAPDPFGVR